MSRLYASPLRVYLCLGLLAVIGIYSGFKLPVSLFPNSSKPQIHVEIPYGSAGAEDFLNTYGRYLEPQLRQISTDSLKVEQVRASYNSDGVEYDIEFKWGNQPKAAKKEVESVVNAFSSRFTDEVRNGLEIQMNNRSSGFLAVSFYSATRSLDEVYDLIEPILAPRLAKVPDALNPEIYNPSQKEIHLELIPEKMAAFQLFPKDIERAVTAGLSSYSAGNLTLPNGQISIQMPRGMKTVEELHQVLVATPSGRMIHLSDVARIDMGLKTNDAESFKTSGSPSIIISAHPRPDGNVKRMAEDMLEVIREVMPTFPGDIRYKVLVDPSEFISSAVNNVFHEVAIGALLAVVILFLFIGSFRNVATAAIEIPISMVMAFILMRFSGMNLNLISLGGLALSAGMNVDGSVVVMENIFRHFDAVKGPLDYEGRLKLIAQAVREVRFPVIASTIASLVVFLPLAFTSELSYAVLGDLAKTVVFSHGLSAFVALILVPTVRLQLLSREAEHGGIKPVHSPLEGGIRKLENFYGNTLRRFILSARARALTYGGLAVLLAVLLLTVLPRLPKEIIGIPDTDWMTLSISTQGNSLLRQMESQAEETEADLLAQFGSEIQYTFTEVYGANFCFIMARLKDKKKMDEIWKRMEAHFVNTPFLNFGVKPFNPSEMPIPSPPQLRIAVRGGKLMDRAYYAEEIYHLLQEKQFFPRMNTRPAVGRMESVLMIPHLQQWPALKAEGATFLPADLADLARVATVGRRIGIFMMNSKGTDVYMAYPPGFVGTPEDLGALPIGLGTKIVPLKSLAEVKLGEVPPTIYREDEREVFTIEGFQNKGDEHFKATALEKQAHEAIVQWQKEKAASDRTPGTKPTVYFEDAQKDLNEALKQLGTAVALSILLIFLTLLLQFGSVINSLLVLVAIPLGLIGVLLSLFIFRSTLSLNSALGVILLNGIAVANSIILVDFIKRLVDGGMAPLEAAVEAARKRLRPILITSLTTILGMLPVALGMGDGGKILQPLGIAVSGGLWFSMGFTLLIVPALQVSYLEWSRRGLAVEPAFAGLKKGEIVVASVRPDLQQESGIASLGKFRESPKATETGLPPELLQ